MSDLCPNRGENFDPKEHEGIQMVPDDELEPNTIIECVQAGYGIKERILRLPEFMKNPKLNP